MIKPMKWELKMHEARALRRQGAAILYDRIALLIACYDDLEFMAWHEAAGTNELDFLDEELSDTALTFMSLRSVMESNPNRQDWIKHNIRDLIAITVKAEADAADKEQGPGEKRIPWRQRALVAEAECVRLRTECECLRDECGRADSLLRILAAPKCN